MNEDDGAPPGCSSPPKPQNMESEEPKELMNAEDHSEDESKEIEDDDDEEDEDEDGSSQLPSLLDMIDLPPSSPLPPTPPLPSSPRDSNMEQEESEDEGPPPGWDKSYQLKQHVEQILAFAAMSANLSDIKMKDVQQDARNGDAAVKEVVPSDIKVEDQESEDEGPPPGWDARCQPEPVLHVACPTIIQSDIKMEDVQQDAQNGDNVSTDIKVEDHEHDDSEEDEGPPPGWDARCHPEPELQVACPTATQSDIKREDLQPDLVPSDIIKMEEQGPPPGWDAKCHQSTITTQSVDIKTEDVDPQTHHHTQPPQLVKEHEHESEDEGPPPGWDAKCQPQPNPTTPPSDSKKIENNDQQEDEEGPPPGWEQQSQDHSNQPSPIPPSSERMECEQQKNNVVEPHQFTPPNKPLLKSQSTTNNPEMGQMVCGSCRRLLSYPKGARYVECGCCLEENYVLEEHEVGQVICGGCDVLLMYPYGAPKVRCVNCNTETEILDQNRRPPLSEQQRRGRRHFKRVLRTH